VRSAAVAIRNKEEVHDFSHPILTVDVGVRLTSARVPQPIENAQDWPFLSV